MRTETGGPCSAGEVPLKPAHNSIAEATALLGWWRGEMTQAIAAGEVEVMATSLGKWLWREELMAKALEIWALARRRARRLQRRRACGARQFSAGHLRRRIGTRVRRFRAIASRKDVAPLFTAMPTHPRTPPLGTKAHPRSHSQHRRSSITAMDVDKAHPNARFTSMEISENVFKRRVHIRGRGRKAITRWPVARLRCFSHLHSMRSHPWTWAWLFLPSYLHPWMW